MFIPQVDGRALDFIKICAAVFMVIDHVNMSLLGSRYPEMFLTGRIAFPLFCYALAAGLMKAAAVRPPRYLWTRYIPRLLMIALITEPVARFSRDIGEIGNVLFTLALGAAAMALCRQLRDWQAAALCALAIALMYFPPLFEFSTAGVMLPAMFARAMQGNRMGLACLAALLASINIPGFAALLEDGNPNTAVFIGTITLVCIFPTLALIRFAAAALPQDGRYLPKYFLHVFYPAHLLVIWGIGRFFMGIGD
jgi:hypothetical protein